MSLAKETAPSQKKRQYLGVEVHQLRLRLAHGFGTCLGDAIKGHVLGACRVEAQGTGLVSCVQQIKL
jgi:hypothetical protein